MHSTHQRCHSVRSSKTFGTKSSARSVAAQAGKTSVHKLIAEGPILVPGCYDALSARVMEKAGFTSAFVSGYAVSATLLGEPDMGLLTMPEMARKAGQISSSAPSLVVFADADTGGGNVLNVQRTIKNLIASGCKGVFIEDKDWPKRPSAGNLRSNPVIAMEEFAGKVAAAREAIGDADFFLVARTDARGTSAKFGFDDAVTRANLYMDAGADASFIVGPRTPEELAEVCKRTHGPKVASMIEGSITPMLSFEELKAIGFDIVIHPLSSLYAATKALTDVYETLKTKGTTRGDLSSLSNYKDFSSIINGDEKFAVMERLTSRDEGNKLTVKVRAPSREV